MRSYFRLVWLAAIALLVYLVLGTTWDGNQRVTTNTYIDGVEWSEQRNVVVDSTGRVHVVWASQPYRWQVWYSRWTADSGWSNDTCISRDITTLNCRYPSVALDSTGVVHVIWLAGSGVDNMTQVFLKSCWPRGAKNDSWQPSATRLSSTSTWPKLSACVAAGPAPLLFAAWTEVYGAGGACLFRERRTSWSTAVKLDSGPYSPQALSISSTGDSGVALAYQRCQPDAPGRARVMLKLRLGSTWRDTIRLADGYLQDYPCVASCPGTGRVHVVWRGKQTSGEKWRICYRTYDTLAGLGDVDTMPGCGPTLEQYPPQLELDRTGVPHVVWAGQTVLSTYYRRCRYSYNKGTTWETPGDVSTVLYEALYPSIAADVAGGLHCLWCDSRTGATREVWYDHRAGPTDLWAMQIKYPGAIVDSGVPVRCSVRVRDMTSPHVVFACGPALVRCKLYSTGAYKDSTIRYMQPGQDSTFGLAVFTPSVRGSCVWKCTLACARDTYYPNDTCYKSVFCRVRDIGVKSIERPLVSEPPVPFDPEATLHNWGNTREACSVRMSIDCDPPYDCIVPLAGGLPVGADTTIIFATWPASAGTYTADCHTTLTGDLVTSNDEVLKAFEVGD